MVLFVLQEIVMMAERLKESYKTNVPSSEPKDKLITQG